MSFFSERLNVSTAKVLDDYNTVKYLPTDASKGEAHVDYLVEMDKDSDLYMFLPTKYERNCNIWVSDEESYENGYGTMNFAGQFFVGDNYSILNLGKFLKNMSEYQSGILDWYSLICAITAFMQAILCSRRELSPKFTW